MFNVGDTFYATVLGTSEVAKQTVTSREDYGNGHTELYLNSDILIVGAVTTRYDWYYHMPNENGVLIWNRGDKAKPKPVKDNVVYLKLIERLRDAA